MTSAGNLPGRFGFADLHQRFPVLAALDQILRRLQRPADLGTQALLRDRGAAERKARGEKGGRRDRTKAAT